MSTASINFTNKTATLTDVPYESASDMAAIIELVENATQKRADNIELEKMEDERVQDVQPQA